MLRFIYEWFMCRVRGWHSYVKPGGCEAHSSTPAAVPGTCPDCGWENSVYGLTTCCRRQLWIHVEDKQ